MTTTDQLRTVLRDLEAKAKEMELDKKLTTFADQADQFLRVAATRAGDYAAENRERVEATLDKAGAKVDEKTEGKYADSFAKVRAGILTGVDWVAEQREGTGMPSTSGTSSASGTPSSASTTDGASTTDAAATADGDVTSDGGPAASESSPAAVWSDVADAAPQDGAVQGSVPQDGGIQDDVVRDDSTSQGPTDPR